MKVTVLFAIGKKYCRQEGIDDELDKIPGTGAEGRLTKDDLLNYIQQQGNKTSCTASSTKWQRYQPGKLLSRGFKPDYLNRAIAERPNQNRC